METVIVDGQEVTKEKLQEMQKDKSLKLKEISPGVFKTLQKLKG